MKPVIAECLGHLLGQIHDISPSSQATVFESVFYSLHMEGVENGLKYRGLRRWIYHLHHVDLILEIEN